jgi:hypothetical protein
MKGIIFFMKMMFVVSLTDIKLEPMKSECGEIIKEIIPFRTWR